MLFPIGILQAFITVNVEPFFCNSKVVYEITMMNIARARKTKGRIMFYGNYITEAAASQTQEIESENKIQNLNHANKLSIFVEIFMD